MTERPGPFDLDRAWPFAWADELKPIDYDTLVPEAFETWWARHRARLSHLPPELCEQWIYRHWTNSMFAFLPLETLRWERRSWTADELIGSVYAAWDGRLCPEHDYASMQDRGGDHRHETARDLDAGSWTYPMVLLSTPSGVVNEGDQFPEVRLVLVEGHKRRRYLNAMRVRGEPMAEWHETIIIGSPLVDAG